MTSHYSVDIYCKKCEAYMHSTYSADDCGKENLCDRCKPKKRAAKKRSIADIAYQFAHQHGVYTHGEPPNKTEGDAWWAFTEDELRKFAKEYLAIKEPK